MSRTPAKFTQADIARATRAAKSAGAGAVRLMPDGSIKIELEAVEKAAEAVEPEREIRL
jgi:L-alanine-DL-glutamate epimerase-like enolase superfamily enzyme